MKTKTLVNTLIAGSIFLILYYLAGHDYVKFYFGGETEILETAVQINNKCNTNGSCPATLEGWQAVGSRSNMLRKNGMLYIAISGKESKDRDKSVDYDAFKLIYSFFAPDHWFEVQGGVGKSVTSGWKNR